MKRRDFLKHGLQSFVLVSSAVALPEAGAGTQLAAAERRIFRSYIDTLIPADTTPSASQLGLDNQLIQHARGIENYPELIALGCQWLKSQSLASFRAGFEQLPEARREKIVRLAENSAHASIPRQFFERVKSDLFGFYYAHPASWVGLQLASPPQPAGYPDYIARPKRRLHG